jgi:hypothetical protein
LKVEELALCVLKSGVKRRFDSESTTLEDVGVDHGGFDIFVSEQFLDGTNIVTVLQKLGGEGMPFMESSP